MLRLSTTCCMSCVCFRLNWRCAACCCMRFRFALRVSYVVFRSMYRFRWWMAGSGRIRRRTRITRRRWRRPLAGRSWRLSTSDAIGHFSRFALCCPYRRWWASSSSASFVRLCRRFCSAHRRRRRSFALFMFRSFPPALRRRARLWFLVNIFFSLNFALFEQKIQIVQLVWETASYFKIGQFSDHMNRFTWIYCFMCLIENIKIVSHSLIMKKRITHSWSYDDEFRRRFSNHSSVFDALGSVSVFVDDSFDIVHFAFFCVHLRVRSYVFFSLSQFSYGTLVRLSYGRLFAVSARLMGNHSSSHRSTFFR